MLKKYWKKLKNFKVWISIYDNPGQAFHTAFIKVANGIEKNTPQKPNKLPKINTASIITMGCNFTASEKIIGTKRFPSRNWSNK